MAGPTRARTHRSVVLGPFLSEPVVEIVSTALDAGLDQPRMEDDEEPKSTDRVSHSQIAIDGTRRSWTARFHSRLFSPLAHHSGVLQELHGVQSLVLRC